MTEFELNQDNLGRIWLKIWIRTWEMWIRTIGGGVQLNPPKLSWYTSNSVTFLAQLFSLMATPWLNPEKTAEASALVRRVRRPFDHSERAHFKSTPSDSFAFNSFFTPMQSDSTGFTPEMGTTLNSGLLNFLKNIGSTQHHMTRKMSLSRIRLMDDRIMV